MPTDPMERAQRAFDAIRNREGLLLEALAELREALGALKTGEDQIA